VLYCLCVKLSRDLRERGREDRGEIPAPEFDELEPEAMAMGVCVVAMAAVVLPVAHANPRSVGDVGGGGYVRTINLVWCAGGGPPPPPPPTLYIVRRQGPFIHERTDAPN
jgi:hypothetical protein